MMSLRAWRIMNSDGFCPHLGVEKQCCGIKEFVAFQPTCVVYMVIHAIDESRFIE